MATKPKQLELPNVTIEVKLPSGAWQTTQEVPTEGRYRLKSRKRPSDKK